MNAPHWRQVRVHVCAVPVLRPVRCLRIKWPVGQSEAELLFRRIGGNPNPDQSEGGTLLGHFSKCCMPIGQGSRGVEKKEVGEGLRLIRR